MTTINGEAGAGENVFYVMRNQKKLGPFVKEQIIKFIENKKIVATDFVSKDGEGEWTPISLAAEFSEVFIKQSDDILDSGLNSLDQGPLLDSPAQLVLLRRRSATGGMYKVIFTVDGKKVGQLNENDTLAVAVEPGQHSIEVSGSGLKKLQLIKVSSYQLLEFETQFSNWGILGGGFLLKPINITAMQAAKAGGPQKTSYDGPAVHVQAVVILTWLGVGLILSGLSKSKEAGTLWMVIWVAAPLAFYWYRHTTICPNCEHAWAKSHVGTRLIDRRGGYKTIMRSKDIKNERGERIGKIEGQEQVHVVKERLLNFYECKHCGHEWTRTSTNEYEG